MILAIDCIFNKDRFIKFIFQCIRMKVPGSEALKGDTVEELERDADCSACNR